MKSEVVGRSMGFRAGAILTLWVGIVVAPGSALAGCSSRYAPAFALSGRLETGAQPFDQVVAQVIADAARTPDPPQPCQGAMCSGRPAIPLAPAPFEVQRLDSWATLEVAPSVVKPVPTAPGRVEGNVRPILCPRSVFHPPRPSLPLES